MKTLLCLSLISKVHCHTWVRLQQPQEQCYSILPVYVIFQYLLAVAYTTANISATEHSENISATEHSYLTQRVPLSICTSVRHISVFAYCDAMGNISATEHPGNISATEHSYLTQRVPLFIFCMYQCTSYFSICLL